MSKHYYLGFCNSH